MKAALAIAERDIRSFFSSPVAYVVLTVWMLACGAQFLFFCNYFAENPAQGPEDNPIMLFYGGTFLFQILIMVFAPIMTMRLFAEGKATGTEEALFTTPVSVTSLVAGKYIAAMVYWLALWLPTLMYVWIASRFGYADLGTTSAVLFGIFMLGLSHMALGMLASALAPNQIVAAVLAFLMMSMLFVTIFFSMVGNDYAEIFKYISPYEHLRTYSRGIIDSRYVMFDLVTAALAVYFTGRAVHGRRYQ